MLALLIISSLSICPVISNTQAFAYDTQNQNPQSFTQESSLETVENIFEQMSRDEQAEKIRFREYLKEDLELFEQKQNTIDDIYKELLKRTALEKLVDSAFWVSAIDTDTVYKSVLSELRIYKKRFPGLAAQSREQMEKLIADFSATESRQNARKEIAYLLIMNSIAIKALEHQSENLILEFRKISEKEKEKKEELSFKILARTIAIDKILTANPLMMLMLLDHRGPENPNATSYLSLNFKLAQSETSIAGLLVKKYEDKEPIEDILQASENAILKWLPTLKRFILKSRLVDLEFRSLKTFFRHGAIRKTALESIEGVHLSDLITAYDMEKAHDYGYAKDENNARGSSNSEKLLSAAEIGGFIISAPIGAILAISNGIDKTLNGIADNSAMTAGGFIGWNDYESIRAHNAFSLFRPLLAGVSHAITGAIIRIKIGNWIGKIFDARVLNPGASLSKIILSRLGGSSAGISAIVSAGPLSAMQLAKEAIKNFAIKNSSALIFAGANVVASEAVLVYSSMLSRNKTAAELLTDQNFWRDVWLVALVDSLMAFYAANNKSFVDAAFVLGAISATSSIFAQYKEIGRIDWDRTTFDYAFLASFSNIKLRMIFKLKEGLKPILRTSITRRIENFFIENALKNAPMSIGRSGSQMLGNALSKSVDPSVLMALFLANNFVGNYASVDVGRRLEMHELDAILMKAMDAQAGATQRLSETEEP